MDRFPVWTGQNIVDVLMERKRMRALLGVQSICDPIGQTSAPCYLIVAGRFFWDVRLEALVRI